MYYSLDAANDQRELDGKKRLTPEAADRILKLAQGHEPTRDPGVLMRILIEHE